jgi:hypothetical protein
MLFVFLDTNKRKNCYFRINFLFVQIKMSEFELAQANDLAEKKESYEKNDENYNKIEQEGLFIIH